MRLRLAEVLLPRVREPGNAQVRHGEADEPGLGLGADAGRALVADLAAGAGRGPPGNGAIAVGWLCVSTFMSVCVSSLAAPYLLAFARMKARDRRAFHHGGVVGVRDDRSLRMRAMRLADHREQALVLRDAVDDPALR